MSFFLELKRRSVFRVGATYLVVSWLLIQIVATVSPMLNLPEGLGRFILIALIIGFPVCLILTWAIELTSSGIKLTEKNIHGENFQGANSQKLNYIFLGLLVIAILISSYSWVTRDKTDDQWVLEDVVSEIKTKINDKDFLGAYNLAMELENRLPDSQILNELWPQFSSRVSIPSEPTGAKVYWRLYDSEDDVWQLAGITPIADVRLPTKYLRLRFELEGYRSLERSFGSPLGNPINSISDVSIDSGIPIRRSPIKFDTEIGLQEDMIRVPAWEEIIKGEITQFDDYFIERFEVTNQEYKEFVDANGYETERFWLHPFVLEGGELSWQEAMQLFVDRSGRPGPSTWLGGDYPDDEDDYPVTGVSWFEAAAFSVFVGRELPSVYHWRRAINEWNSGALIPASNLQADSARPVGEAAGMSWIGAYDMGGNVREWVFNQVGDQRFVLGGAWNENLYSGLILDAADDPFDRAQINGFRLALTQDTKNVMDLALSSVPVQPTLDLTEFKSVSDETLELFKRQYDYDMSPLNANIEEALDERNWTREKIVIDAAYGSEKLPLYLYLPKNSSPPYQTVIFMPGANMFFMSSIDQGGFPLDFIADNGRAIILPIYKGTYERVDGLGPEPGWETNIGKNRWIEINQDMRRSIDYLETRSDIDMDRLAYLGISWGSQMSPNNLVLDSRIKAAVLGLAGIRLNLRFLPEIDPKNFVERINIPVLMLSAAYDNIFPLETSARPFYEKIGTAEPDKKQVVFEAGHSIPQEILVSETLDWLDKHLDPVE